MVLKEISNNSPKESLVLAHFYCTTNFQPITSEMQTWEQSTLDNELRSELKKQ